MKCIATSEAKPKAVPVVKAARSRVENKQSPLVFPRPARRERKYRRKSPDQRMDVGIDVKRLANGTGKIWIGTSGWTYDGWRGLFYPEDMKPIMAFLLLDSADHDGNQWFVLPNTYTCCGPPLARLRVPTFDQANPPANCRNAALCISDHEEQPLIKYVRNTPQNRPPLFPQLSFQLRPRTDLQQIRAAAASP